MLLAELLIDVGHEVQTAENASSALARLDGFAPEIAILDLDMAVIDGYELARRLRSRLEGSTPRLIALTGHGSATDRLRTESAGFAAHLVKPVRLQQLLETIRGL